MVSKGREIPEIPNAGWNDAESRRVANPLEGNRQTKYHSRPQGKKNVSKIETDRYQDTLNARQVAG
jgi:hypothetical protein